MIKATVLASVALALIASFSLSGCNDAQMAILDAQMSDSPVSEAEAVGLVADLFMSFEEEHTAAPQQNSAAAPQETYALARPAWTITNGPGFWATGIWNGLEQGPTGKTYIMTYPMDCSSCEGRDTAFVMITPTSSTTGHPLCRKFRVATGYGTVDGLGVTAFQGSRETSSGEACRTAEAGWFVTKASIQTRKHLGQLQAISTQ